MTLTVGRLTIPLLFIAAFCGFLNYWTSKSIISSQLKPQPPSSNLSESTIMADPEGLDCKELLKKFRRDEIKVAKTTQSLNGREKNFKRTFGVITNTAKPFYVSTHDKHIDLVRSEIMEHQQYYEYALTERVAEVFDETVQKNESSLFLDVGANIGWYSLVAVAHGASKVYSFEPNLQNTIRFCESLSLNDWLRDDPSKDVVVPISKGVGNKEESRKFYAKGAGDNPGAFSFQGDSSDDTVVDTMELTTLDSFADRHGWFQSKPSIGLMKVDVEHFELEVMEGAGRLLQSNLIQRIAMELKRDHPLVSKRKILRFLYGAGYELYMHGNWKGPNFKVEKSYSYNSTTTDRGSFEELLDDVHKWKLYGENMMFVLRGLVPEEKKRARKKQEEKLLEIKKQKSCNAHDDPIEKMKCQLKVVAEFKYYKTQEENKRKQEEDANKQEDDKMRKEAERKHEDR